MVRLVLSLKILQCDIMHQFSLFLTAHLCMNQFFRPSIVVFCVFFLRSGRYVINTSSDGEHLLESPGQSPQQPTSVSHEGVL